MNKAIIMKRELGIVSLVCCLLILGLFITTCDRSTNVVHTAQTGNTGDSNRTVTVENGEYNKWFWDGNEEDYVFYVVGKTKQANGDVSLKIFDKNRKLLYEESARDFGDIDIIDLLRTRNQLVIKAINYGGSGRFFEILDYQNGKIVPLTSKDDTLYSGGILILPQYQIAKYYSVPYQIILGQYISDTTAEATVLRYLNGKYTSVGSVSQTEIGNSIEKNIKKEE